MSDPVQVRVEASAEYLLIYTTFQPEKKLDLVKKLCDKLPELIFPTVAFSSAASEVLETFKNYIYIQIMEDKRHLKILDALRRNLGGHEFSHLGKIPGSDILKFMRNVQETSSKKFQAGDTIRVLRGEYSGVRLPVITCEGDQVYCEVEIFYYKTPLVFNSEDVELAKEDPLPSNPFVNYVKLAQDNKMRNAIVIDGMFLAYRSTFRYSNLFAKNNTVYVGTAYGFYLSLLKLKTMYPEAEVFVVFDGKNTSKYEKNPEYKANRDKYTPAFYERFNANLEWIRKFIANTGFHYIKQDDQEGDDVLGSVATSLVEEHGFAHVRIFSYDTDFYQMVCDKVSLLIPKRSSTGPGVTESVYLKDALEFFGVDSPSKINWVRAVMGDTSDNIFSVNKFNSLEKLPHKLVQSRFPVECSNKANSLEEYKALLATKPAMVDFLSRQFDKNLELLTIRTDLLKGQKDFLTRYQGTFNHDSLMDLFEDFSFYKEADAFSRNSRILQSEW